MKDSNRKLLETVADIAYIAGTKKYYSGDSRADINDFIYWATQFEKIHINTEWGNEDYIIAIENFTNEKLKMEDCALSQKMNFA
jgi:hypothetical protein